MDIRKLQRAIVDGLEDVKAQNITVFNTEHLSSMFERVIIASGSSNRQTKALASSVRESVKSRGMPVLSTEGEDNGEWIIVDCGAAVVHVMQPAIREYYHLEEIWGGKAVKLKLGEAKVGLVKASEPEPAAPAARKRAATKPAPASSTVSAPSKTPSAKKAPARKAVAAPAPARKAAAGKSAASKTVASKTATPKSPARKAAAKVVTLVIQPKTAPRKAAAKKAPARKAAAKGSLRSR
jgi:ribosome-associated protein